MPNFKYKSGVLKKKRLSENYQKFRSSTDFGHCDTEKSPAGIHDYYIAYSNIYGESDAASKSKSKLIDSINVLLDERQSYNDDILQNVDGSYNLTSKT